VEGGGRGAGEAEVASGIMGDSGAVVGEEGSEDDILSAGGGRMEVSGCDMVGDTRVNGVERGEKVRLGER
jgi:hypothetical protein